MKRFVVPAVCTLLLYIFVGCLNDIEEVPLEVEGEGIAAPGGLVAHVDDGEILLTWMPVDGAVLYRIYRMEGEFIDPVRIAETADTFHTDRGVTNEQQYLYSVSSVDEHGLEGDRSAAISAIPSVYSVMINGGDECTGSRTVILQLTAPVTTILMKVSGDPSLAGGIWETFRITRDWNLEGGDGVKNVYVMFRDESGSESPVMSGSIILDTFAGIEGIAITPEPHVYEPGSTVHLRMNVEDDEVSGRAWIEFEGYSEQVMLYDNAKGGDQTADDGIYEADFTFPEYLRGTDLGAIGGFIDLAGNQAQVFEFDDKISFTDPPEAVYLVGVQDSTINSITIKWIASTEEHFAYYRIYRDVSGGISDDPDEALLVKELNNIAQTGYPDGGLKEGQTYYYRVFVGNDLEETAGSREITAHTFDAYPDPVFLDSLSAIGADRVTLTWSENHNTDFKEYVIYRSTAPGVTTDSDLVTTLSEREVTYFDDTGLDLGSYTYYYRVYVVDNGDKTSRSNEVSTAAP